VLRARLNPPAEYFPDDPWALKSTRFSLEFLPQAETAFALANGYLGMRGNFEEDHPSREPGTYLNGFYETRPIVYGEQAYGFPKVGQSMLNCPDGKIIKLYVDDEPFDLTRAEILNFRRKLDLKDGVYRRDVTWISPSGKRIRLRTTRLVSFMHRHLATVHYQLVAEDGDVEFVIASELINRQPLPVQTSDPRLGEGFVGRVLHPTGTEARDMRAILTFRTLGSELNLGCGMDHALHTDCACTSELSCTDDHASVVIKARGERGKPIRLTKHLSYHYLGHSNAHDIRAQTGWTLDRALKDGFPTLHEQQRVYVQTFWQRADVEIEGGHFPRKQQSMRWNLFQLLQASARAEGCGIGARGLTGQTYEGHYFWDTEIYVVPFLIYVHPRIARSVLKFRYDQLDKARARARELGHRGATFPWRTINGQEASAYYAAGTAQYHINADIMYALRKYVEVTGDVDFLHRFGAEMLVETARLWLSLGNFDERDGNRFCLNGVTGPDEYTAVVNNNYFTNLMARENLRYAAETVLALRREQPDVFAALVQTTGFQEQEADDWEMAAAQMYLPYDEQLGVHPQDDSFLEKAVWDFANTPEENYPLLLHYHPLNLYRHQVLKQADTILAMFLLDHQFSPEDMKRNFDYYDPLTTHDSSLSVCIQSIVANEIGYEEQARQYFDFAIAMDLRDVGGNMMNGAHIASIGGSWMALVYGFAGMRDHHGVVSFRPRIPDDWRRLRFRLTVHGNLVEVDVRPDVTTYTLKEGDGLTLFHQGAELNLSPDAPLVDQPTRPRTPQS
jgi:alpha,alpha-trehalose phosphorylase